MVTFQFGGWQIWQKNLVAKKWSTDIRIQLAIFLPHIFLPYFLTCLVDGKTNERFEQELTERTERPILFKSVPASVSFSVPSVVSCSISLVPATGRAGSFASFVVSPHWFSAEAERLGEFVQRARASSRNFS
jgi:hypothetical protein